MAEGVGGRAYLPRRDRPQPKPKFYALVEFPYPSAAGLHVGHPRSYTALDIVARKKRQCGYNVLYPMGWDAFGLPTENYALKNHINPEIVTAKNVARFKAQLQERWACPSTGTARSTPPIPNTTSGPSGSSCSSSRRAWPIRRRPRSTTAPAARSCWPTRKSSTVCANVAAARSSTRSRASGCSRSRPMPTA